MIAATAVRQPSERLQYHLIFAAAFAAYLPIVGWNRSRLALAREAWPNRSLLAEAWAASATTARLAFAG